MVLSLNPEQGRREAFVWGDVPCPGKDMYDHVPGGRRRSQGEAGRPDPPEVTFPPAPTGGLPSPGRCQGVGSAFRIHPRGAWAKASRVYHVQWESHRTGDTSLWSTTSLHVPPKAGSLESRFAERSRMGHSPRSANTAGRNAARPADLHTPLCFRNVGRGRRAFRMRRADPPGEDGVLYSTPPSPGYYIQ